MSQLVSDLRDLGYDHIVTERTAYGFRVYPSGSAKFFYFDHYGQPLEGL